jgi:aspartate aminotransferase-like enzyme
LNPAISSTGDPLLFTPGPLTTSPTVKEAMLHDAGSWHFDFNQRVNWIREQLFRPYLTPAVQSSIITAFHYPDAPRFQFGEFYRLLSEKGFIIYPGKLCRADTFRIANIGPLFERDIGALVAAIREVIEVMGVRLKPNNHAAPHAD